MVYTVAVAGASGYAGGELVRLIAGHPEFQLKTVTANSNAGKPLASVHPHLASLHLELHETTAEVLDGHDIIFLALPHGKSGELGDSLKAQLVIDCGADHRLTGKDDWEDYYGGYYSPAWVYGMPELWNRYGEISVATRIAVPGCNATAVTLGFAPLVFDPFLNGPLIETDDLVSVLAVGVSGAGKTLREDLLASEILGSASAYAVGGKHRHIPEIIQNLKSVDEGHNDFALSFTPILVPMSRGILATNTATLRKGVTIDMVRDAFMHSYSIHQFIHLLPEGQQPRTADVVGSNSVHIQVEVDERARRVVATVAIDNLGKGTAGAAIQSANIALRLEDNMGLTTFGVAP